MKKILIGTHNKGKFKEIAFLIGKKLKKKTPQALGLKSPRETGRSFAENAKLKVNYFSKFTNLPVISDDSGLCINSLNGKPGIYSARWAKKHGSFFKAMKFILKRMKNKKNRTAYFKCSLSFKYPGKKSVTVVGSIKGSISKKIIGKNGFGYDPIFIPFSFKKTFGEMSKIKKIKMDHRFLAFKKIKKKIRIL